MSVDLIKERARERLAAAELATVLGVSVGNVEGREQKPQLARWLVAATLLLGLGVAVGSAWLRSDDDDDDSASQQRGPIDVVDPMWHKHISRYFSRLAVGAGGIAAIADDVESVQVRLTRGAQAWLRELTTKPQIRHLGMDLLRDSAASAADWRAIADMPNLECLTLHSTLALRPEHLRELRHAPKLESIIVDLAGAHGVTFGGDVAAALAELPRLRMLVISGRDVPSDALRALAGLQHLDTLVLERMALDEEAFEVLSELTQLRTLVFLEVVEGGSLSAAHMQSLNKMPRLRVLNLTAFEVRDEDLRNLPEQLEALTLARLSRLTPAGVSALAELPNLRSLAIRTAIAPALEPAVVKVIEARKLENFECSGSPTAAMWRALQGSPRLRGLMIQAGSHLDGALKSQFLECAKLEHLGDLEMGLALRVDPSDLLPLRELKHLRTVRLTMPGLDASVMPTEDRKKALESCLGPNVKVIIRM